MFGQIPHVTKPPPEEWLVSIGDNEVVQVTAHDCQVTEYGSLLFFSNGRLVSGFACDHWVCFVQAEGE